MLDNVTALNLKRCNFIGLGRWASASEYQLDSPWNLGLRMCAPDPFFKVFTYSQPVRVPGAWRDGKLQRLVWPRE
jgi:hypothetical protein